jgi:DNA-directed RNA polymerase subunit RPC12/RpoP
MDDQIEKPKRPTLRLKFPPPMPVTPMTPVAKPAKPGVAAAVKAPEWKCKPCGTAFQVPSELTDEESVRCPSCNAKLGLAKDFRDTPPNTSRLRARFVA